MTSIDNETRLTEGSSSPTLDQVSAVCATAFGRVFDLVVVTVPLDALEVKTALDADRTNERELSPPLEREASPA